MLYLVDEMTIVLAIAALLGFVLGWIFKSFFTKKSNANDKKLLELQSENDNLMEKLYDMEASPSSKAAGNDDVNGDYGITEIEGIGPGYKAKMDQNFGINNVMDFIEKGATKTGRKQIAKALKVDEKVVSRWIRMADLTRVSGIRGHFAELIEAAGIESIGHLAAQDPKELTAILVDVNKKQNHSRIDPTLEMVDDWVSKAKGLEEMVA